MPVDNRQQFRWHRVGMAHAFRLDSSDDSASELFGVLLEQFALSFGTSSCCASSGAALNNARLFQDEPHPLMPSWLADALPEIGRSLQRRVRSQPKRGKL
jgi:hypothetical protein